MVRAMVTPIDGTPAVTPDRILAATREADRRHAAEEVRIALAYHTATEGADAGDEGTDAGDAARMDQARVDTSEDGDEPRNNEILDAGTEGNGTVGDGTAGDGTEGGGTEGDGTEGDGTEGDGSDGTSTITNSTPGNNVPGKRHNRKDNREKAQAAPAATSEATLAILEAIRQRDDMLAVLLTSMNVGGAVNTDGTVTPAENMRRAHKRNKSHASMLRQLSAV